VTTRPSNPNIGSIVLYGFFRDGVVHERPAIVVKVNRSVDDVNLQVFTDGGNDDALLMSSEQSTRSDSSSKTTRCVVWRNRVPPADHVDMPQANRWRWVPR